MTGIKAAPSLSPGAKWRENREKVAELGRQGFRVSSLTQRQCRQRMPIFVFRRPLSNSQLQNRSPEPFFRASHWRAPFSRGRYRRCTVRIKNIAWHRFLRGCQTYPCLPRNRAPSVRINLAIISMAIPIPTRATATSHKRIRGSTTTATPKIMSTLPATISPNPDRGLAIIPLHVSAIGHIGNEADSAIVSSIRFEKHIEFD